MISLRRIGRQRTWVNEGYIKTINVVFNTRRYWVVLITLQDGEQIVSPDNKFSSEEEAGAEASLLARLINNEE